MTRSPQLRLLPFPDSTKSPQLDFEGERSVEEVEAATVALRLISWELGRCPLAALVRPRAQAEPNPEVALEATAAARLVAADSGAEAALTRRPVPPTRPCVLP